MTTRELIIEKALDLFSEKGYQGTSVKNIADAVGIKDSSLYKHFTSKKEIFDTIVAEMSERMKSMSDDLGLPENRDMETAAQKYATLTEQGLEKLSIEIFLFYMRDAFASRFRHMLTIEQYQNREIYQVYRELFMEAAIQYQSLLFQEMIRQGAFEEANPKMMALYFYAPIFFLLNKYDQEPEKEEEALEELREHVREFGRIYGVKRS